tara:strand:+ start:1031 stop:1537 length:507 start_codon:yes stop_codon:yes gene_type:complete
MIGVGQKFPEFELQGVNEDNEIGVIADHDIMGWAVIYFYPKDFTFICPTEIAGFDSLTNDATVIGISGDNEYCKHAWREVNGGIRNIDHWLAADCGLYLADELGIVNEEEGVPYRATYILDDMGYIQHVSVNGLDTGRNHEEIARTLAALKEDGLTGCGWQPGEDFVA